MAKTTFKIEGFKELENALMEMSRATANNVARRALIKAGQPVADKAKDLVPVASGDLRDSISVSTKTSWGSKPGADVFAAAMRSGATRREAGQAMRAATKKGARSSATVYIGAGQEPHAHLVEFGSVNNSPQPYLRPAWDAGKDKVLEDVRNELEIEVSKAAKRMAAKALRASKSKI